MPPPKPWVPQETLDEVGDLSFRRQLDDALAGLRFQSALPAALEGIKTAAFGPGKSTWEPLPIVVSERPDAARIARQQQATAPAPVEMPTAPSVPEAPAVGYPGDGSQPGGGAPTVPGAATPGSPAAPASAPATAPTSAPSGPPGAGVERWSSLVDEASRTYGVPPSVIKGIMHIESGGDPGAVSKAGALGLMQTMPFHYGQGEDGMDPRTNVLRGTKILADNYRTYGDWDRAAAAYFGAIDANGNITDASDGNTTGSNYVRLFRDAAGRYGGVPGAAPPTAGAASPSAPAAPPRPPAAAAVPPTQQPAGGSEATLTIRNPVNGATLTIPSRRWPDFEPGGWQVVQQDALRQSLGQDAGAATSMKAPAEPMPGSSGWNDDGTPAPLPGSVMAPGPEPPDRSTEAGLRMLPGMAMPGLAPPKPPVDRLPDDAIYRQPLAPTMGPDTATGQEYDPRDADQGPRELIPSSGSAPVSVTPSSAPVSDPTIADPAYTQAPQPAPSWTVGPVDASGPAYGPPAEPDMIPPPSPYASGQAESMEPAPDRFSTPEPTLTQRAIDAATAPAANAYGPAIREVNETQDAIAARNREKFGEFAQAAAAPLETVNRAVSLANAVLMATPQAAADTIDAALSTVGLDRQSLGIDVPVLGRIGVADILDIGPGGSLTNIGIGRAGTMGTSRVGAAIASRVPNAAGAIERGAGAAVDAAKPLIREGVGAARALGTRVTDALAENAERTAAADARMAARGSTALPGTFGALPEPARQTVEVLQDQLETATRAWQRAREAGDERMAALAREQAVEIESRLVDARNARTALEPAIASDVGRRIEDVPLDARSADDLSVVGRERVRDLGGPLAVDERPGASSVSLNAGFVPGASTLRNAAQGAAVGAASEDVQAQREGREPTLEGRLVRGAIGAGLATVAGSRAARGAGQRLGSGLIPFSGRPASEAASAAPNPTMRRMAQQMAGQYTPSGVTNKRGLSERWAQAMTDDRAGIRNFQEAVSRSIGRPLTASESVAELTRVNPASVASQRLDDEVRAAWQAVGQDDDYLAQYLVHTHNVDVAREMGQRAYDAAIAAGKPPQIASAAAMRAANTRQFSGDLRLGETLQQLQDVEQRVRSLPDGDARWQAIRDAAQATWDAGRRTLERKKDAGIVSDALYADLTTKYPHYMRTDIADYFDKGTGGPAPAGKRLGVSDIGIQKISAEGTTKERVNPLLSFIDQTYSAEAAIARNEAGKAFEELRRVDPSWESVFKEVVPARGVNVGNPATSVPSSYTLKNGEQFLRVWDGGQARTYVIPPEYAALVSPKVPAILNSENLGAKLVVGAMNAYKALITSRNPAFSLVVSPLRDAGDYAVREGALSATKGGALGFAQGAAGAVGAMGDYIRAVPDAFAGILEGTYKGDLARMMREGAGQGRRPGREQGELRDALRDLQRTNGLEVRGVGDVRRLLVNTLTLGAEPLGNRLEQVPRLAAARRAARRGAEPLGQAMAFRDATVDFQRGGEWSRAINTVVPFFNVAMQSGAQTARTFRENPAAFLGAVASTVGTMTLASEAWNNADPQRAADYEDVPDYLKKTGVVFMLPGVEGRSERGDRLPNYAWLPVGQYGALVETAKEAAKHYVRGTGGADLSSARGWGELGADVAGIFSPIRGDSAGAVATSLIPPGLSTAADLAANKDLFRGATIATDRRDEGASAFSRGTAAAANAVTGQETRPSQWEYLYRDLGGYGATLALEGSNLLAERLGMRRPKDEDRPVQNTPVVGGLTNRIVRDAGGQRLETATEDATRVPEGIRPILQEAGMRREDVLAVPSRWHGGTLTREEQTAWQQATNDLAERYVGQAQRSPKWRDPAAREQAVRDAIAKAREDAARRARLPSETEMRRRLQDEQRRKAS